MKNTEIRYCRKCKGDTRHDISHDEEGFERAFFAVFTIGFSETMNAKHYECQACGSIKSTGGLHK